MSKIGFYGVAFVLGLAGTLMVNRMLGFPLWETAEAAKQKPAAGSGTVSTSVMSCFDGRTRTLGGACEQALDVPAITVEVEEPHSKHKVKRVTCAEKERFLLTAEDGSQHCLKF